MLLYKPIRIKIEFWTLVLLRGCYNGFHQNPESAIFRRIFYHRSYS
jgi:hypothetical protein